MHKKKVIDLQNYRGGEAAEPPAADEGDVNLRPGTALLFGQYTILGYINCGGFGITYLAQDSLGRKVAVKECFPGELCYRSGNEMRPRSPSIKIELEAVVDHFVKEAQRLAGLKHDNIVHVHQVFEENATAYIVMDYIDGPDLLDVAESDEAHLRPDVVEALTEKMLHAIAYMHGRGILHRDISPDNILVTRKGEPVLIDFGAAQKTTEKSSNLPSRLKFVKDGYSPQEFYIPGREQGPWSDLYSFAASLHHVIAGYPPEDGQKRLAALAAKETDPYQPLAGRIEGYSPGFLKAIDKALEILPANRIQTAEDWHALLGGNKPAPKKSRRSRPVTDRSGLMALPIENFAASLIERTEKKKPVFLGVAAAALVALLGAIAYLALGDGTAPAPASEPVPPMIASVEPQPTEAEDAPRLAETIPLAAPPEAGVAPLDTAGVAPVDPLEIPETDAPVALVEAAPADPVTPPETTAESAAIAVGTLDAPAPSPSEVPPATLTAEAGAVPEAARIAALSPVVAPVEAAPRLSGASPEAADVPLPKTDVWPEGAPLTFADAPDRSGVATLPVLDKRVFLAAPVRLDPLPAVVLASVAPDGMDPIQSDALSVELEPLAQVLQTALMPVLPMASGEVVFSGDMSPPAYIQKLGSVLEEQVVFSHWDVNMPFDSTVERVRNSNTETITAVAPGADLETSGAWIKDGVVIYSFNGARLLPDTPISVHALNSLSIDPDGYMRASVRYRDPDTGTIDRGLLAMPVVREIGLADGSRIEARVIGLTWVLVVTEAAPGTGLRAGDHLAAEITSGVALDSHEALAAALDRLVAAGAETATFAVKRAGKDVEVTWRLGRES